MGNNQQTLLSRSTSIQREANEFLQQELSDLLDKYGEVFVGGSYFYDLMVWRDLDIYMKAPTITIHEFFQLGAEITERSAAVKSYFTNNRGQNPNGLYWGIRLGDTRAGAWKLDIWAVDEPDYQRHVDYAQTIRQRLTSETRALILQIKDAYWQSAAYRNQITSHVIYEAVLDQKVKSLEEFQQYAHQMTQGSI